MSDEVKRRKVRDRIARGERPFMIGERVLVLAHSPTWEGGGEATVGAEGHPGDDEIATGTPEGYMGCKVTRDFWLCNHPEFWVLLSVLVFLGACAPNKSFKLDSRYLPLREITEDPSRTPRMAFTTGGTVSVWNLKDFLAALPPGSLEFDALMAHEREHSVRQYAKGVDAWVSEYERDSGFRWQEERIGYDKQLNFPGFAFAPVDFAHSMADNYRGMVSYQDALAWIESDTGR